MATLVYLAVQIRNNTAMTRAVLRQARADWSIRNAELFANSEYLPGIMMRIERGESPTEVEVQRWVFFQQAWHRAQEIALIHASEGLLDASIMDGIESVLRRQAQRDSALLWAWETRRHTFDPRYASLVDRILEEEGDRRPSPDTRG